MGPVSKDSKSTAQAGQAAPRKGTKFRHRPPVSEPPAVHAILDTVRLKRLSAVALETKNPDGLIEIITDVESLLAAPLGEEDRQHVLMVLDTCTEVMVLLDGRGLHPPIVEGPNKPGWQQRFEQYCSDSNQFWDRYRNYVDEASGKYDPMGKSIVSGATMEERAAAATTLSDAIVGLAKKLHSEMVPGGMVTQIFGPQNQQGIEFHVAFGVLCESYGKAPDEECRRILMKALETVVYQFDIVDLTSLNARFVLSTRDFEAVKVLTNSSDPTIRMYAMRAQDGFMAAGRTLANLFDSFPGSPPPRQEDVEN